MAEEAIYTHADGREEIVELRKRHPECAAFTIFVPSLGRERQTTEKRLQIRSVSASSGAATPHQGGASSSLPASASTAPAMRRGVAVMKASTAVASGAAGDWPVAATNLAGPREGGRSGGGKDTAATTAATAGRTEKTKAVGPWPAQPTAPVPSSQRPAAAAAPPASPTAAAAPSVYSYHLSLPQQPQPPPPPPPALAHCMPPGGGGGAAAGAAAPYSEAKTPERRTGGGGSGARQWSPSVWSARAGSGYAEIVDGVFGVGVMGSPGGGKEGGGDPAEMYARAAVAGGADAKEAEHYAKMLRATAAFEGRHETAAATAYQDRGGGHAASLDRAPPIAAAAAAAPPASASSWRGGGGAGAQQAYGVAVGGLASATPVQVDLGWRSTDDYGGGTGMGSVLGMDGAYRPQHEARGSLLERAYRKYGAISESLSGSLSELRGGDRGKGYYSLANLHSVPEGQLPAQGDLEDLDGLSAATKQAAAYRGHHHPHNGYPLGGGGGGGDKDGEYPERAPKRSGVADLICNPAAHCCTLS